MDSSLIVLIVLSLFLGCGCWLVFLWAVKKGEFVPAVIRLSAGGFVLTAGKGFMSKKLNWTRA